MCFYLSRRRRYTRWPRDWSSDVCSSDLAGTLIKDYEEAIQAPGDFIQTVPIAGWSFSDLERRIEETRPSVVVVDMLEHVGDRKSVVEGEREGEGGLGLGQRKKIRLETRR